METIEFVRAISVLLPAVSALICATVVLLSYLYTFTRQARRLKRIAIFYFFTSSFNWINLLFSDHFPELLFVTNTIWCFTILFNPVLLHRIISHETGKMNKKAGLFFYSILPGVTASFLLVILLSRHYSIPPEKEFSSIFFSLFSDRFVVYLISLFGTFYVISGLWSLYHSCQKERTKQKDAFRWRVVFPLSAICILLFFMPPGWFLFSVQSNWYTWSTFLLTGLLSLLHIYFTVHMIGISPQMVYRVLPPIADDLSGEIINKGLQQLNPVIQLNKAELNHWIKKHKPYLQPNLKLEVMAGMIGVSPKELSGFINRRYQLNFNQYINRWRIEEVNKMRKSNAHKKIRLSELVKSAGFGSMVSYARARAEAQNKKRVYGSG